MSTTLGCFDLHSMTQDYNLTEPTEYPVGSLTSEYGISDSAVLIQIQSVLGKNFALFFGSILQPGCSIQRCNSEALGETGVIFEFQLVFKLTGTITCPSRREQTAGVSGQARDSNPKLPIWHNSWLIEPRLEIRAGFEWGRPTVLCRQPRCFSTRR